MQETKKRFQKILLNSHPGKQVEIASGLVWSIKKAGRLESHLLWSFYDRSHEKTVYNLTGYNPGLFFTADLKIRNNLLV
jgi:hypothetical protein